jgi:hypothetical protein
MRCHYCCRNSAVCLGAYRDYEWFARQAEELQTLVRVLRGYQKAYDFAPGFEQPLAAAPELPYPSCTSEMGCRCEALAKDFG